jgi:hypothetical protein
MSQLLSHFTAFFIITVTWISTKLIVIQHLRKPHCQAFQKQTIVRFIDIQRMIAYVV